MLGNCAGFVKESVSEKGGLSGAKYFKISNVYAEGGGGGGKDMTATRYVDKREQGAQRYLGESREDITLIHVKSGGRGQGPDVAAGKVTGSGGGGVHKRAQGRD